MAFSILKRWRTRRDSETKPAILSASERKLEASIRRFKILEYLSAAVVVVGIAKESFALFMWLWARSGLFSAVWTIWGGIAVAVGVAAETLFSMMVSSREGKLHSIEADKRVKAEEKTAEALREVAELQRENLELQKALAPRMIRFGKPLDPLRQYSGVHVRIKAIPDFEARRTAVALSLALSSVGWITDHPFNIDEGFKDGIAIFNDMNPSARKLSAALVEYLGNVTSHCREAGLSPPYSLDIQVGYKPSYPDGPHIAYFPAER